MTGKKFERTTPEAVGISSKSLERLIENLEQELNLIQTEMEQCGSDYVKLQTLTDRQQETSARLEERMERWAELTEMAEAMQKHGGNQ